MVNKGRNLFSAQKALILHVSVRPQMVDIGSEQGLNNFETAGIAGYVEDFKRAKTPLRAKRCCLWMGNTKAFLTGELQA